MAHRTLKSGYALLADRLNRFPQGAPPSDLLFKILKMLFGKQEAALAALLPLRPFTAQKASRIWDMDLATTKKHLDDLARRAILVDIEREDEIFYVLPPPMAGFFEFSMMRVQKNLDQKLLSELLYQYLNVEEDFIRDLFTSGKTQLGRVFVHEPILSAENALQVLDYERASEVIKTASHIGIGLCYCRHKMQHVGRACNAPMEICMSFNTAAASLIRHGFARKVDAAECLDLLHRAYEQNLVQFGENVRQGIDFICNCCKCCCEAMIAARRFAIYNPVHTTNFLPRVAPESCSGCGKCVPICPVDAISIKKNGAHTNSQQKTACIDTQVCLGCGVCAKNCPSRAIKLLPREKRVLTPLNTSHRTVLMAIERGKLQDYIFDNRVLWSHRALAAVLGSILRLPPIKRAAASDQVKSRYLEMLLRRFDPWSQGMGAD